MPWKDATAMEQKVEFICEWNSGKYTSQNYAEFLLSRGQQLID
ncbi:hypothetical protein ACFLSU_08785 [Bacteroidota bacterium]